jgi:hypothetical protein
MARIIDTNRHGIRREIDHQWKPKKKEKYNGNKQTKEVTKQDKLLKG